MILQTDNWAEIKNKIINKFCSERNVQQIYWMSYNPPLQEAVEAFNRIVQDFLTLAKEQQMDSYTQKWIYQWRHSEVILLRTL